MKVNDKEFTDEALALANSIQGIYQKGYQAGKIASKRFAIHNIKSISGNRIVNQDGHWNGDAIVEIKTTTIPSNGSSEGNWADLTLAMDIHYARELVVKLNKWITDIEG